MPSMLASQGTSFFGAASRAARISPNELGPEPSSFSSKNLLALLHGPRRQDRDERWRREKTDIKKDVESGEACEELEMNEDLSVEGSIREEIACGEWVYYVVDSWIVGLVTVLIVTVDCVFFFGEFLGLLEEMVLGPLGHGYRVMDWVTVAAYTLEVGLRLYAYGVIFYFGSILRFLDVVVVVTNLPAVIALQITQTQWLKIARFIRLLRVVTVPILTRERELKWQAREELEELADLLDQERSEEGRLIKWRIDSEMIALGEAMGDGGFGEVFLGLFRGTLVAVKQLYQTNRHQEEYSSIEDEAVTLVNLRHPNVVLFMGFVDEVDKLWIVTEYCSRGSLRDLLNDPSKQLTENRILRFALGAMRGLAYLHGQDPPVLHLDLKTSNILISSGWDAKLADFGLSRRIDDIENNTFAGTVQYSAPEILEANSFSVKADIYSFGICLWELAAREVPFKDLSATEVLWGVVKEELRPTLSLIRNPAKRCPVDLDHLSNPLLGIGPAAVPPKINASQKLSVEGAVVNKAERSRDFDKTENALNAARVERTTAGLNVPSIPLDAFSPVTETDSTTPQQNQIPSFSQPYTTNVKDPATKQDYQPKMTLDKSGSDAVKSRPRRRSGQLENVKTNLPRKAPGQSILTSPLSPRAQKLTAKNQRVSSLPPTSGISDAHQTGFIFGSKKQSSLEHITSRLAAKIQLFEDRPSVARRSGRELPQLSSSSSTSSAANRINAKKRSRIRSLRETVSSPAETGYHKSSAESPRKADNTFLRRMVSFGTKQNTNSRDIPNRKGSTRKGTDSNVDKQPAGLSNLKVLMSDEYLNLITRCWAQDPADRPDANEVVWKLVGLIDNQLRRAEGSNNDEE